MASKARETALTALIMCRRGGAWSDGALKELISRDRLESRDGALATRLCLGVLQNRALLDFYIAAYCTMDMSRLQPVVLDILRLAVYQLLYMDKIPDSAAVDEAVKSAKKHANPRAAGFVNGLLRTVLREKDRLPVPVGDERLSVLYSHPRWLVDELSDQVEDVEALLKANNRIPATFAQVNRLKTTVDAAEISLTAEGVRVQHCREGGLELYSTGSVDKLGAFKKGEIYIQDPAAHMAVLAAAPKPGMRVIDGCAAPGGKSFASAIEMENKGEILAFDIHEHKAQLIEKGAQRLSVDIITPTVGDARDLPHELDGWAELVIADVPCSGLGVIRKKPDIRYKNEEELKRLPQVQLDILRGLSRCVKPGGALLYSTCTLLRRENEDVARAFLAENPGFIAEDFCLTDLASHGGMLTLYPHIHGTDGFFICKMRRTDES